MPLLNLKRLSLFFTISFIGMGSVSAPFSVALANDFTSVNLTGITGLNVIPTARMDEKGTIRVGAGTTDPYLYSFLGFQVAQPLYVSLRQTHEVSGLNDSAKRLYPGLDFKLRLIKESARRPELAIGANSAFGHKRTSSEYIVLSKRSNNFDFTGGIAWGRLAGKGHIKNPLSAVSSHFEKDRNFNDEDPQNIDSWLTGKEISFFGGIEYFTPMKGLSLKADYAAYNYGPESTTNAGLNEAQPWSFAVNYKPWKPVDLSVGVIGAEKVMARLSLQGNIAKWPGKPSQNTKPPELVSPRLDNNGSHQTILNLNSYQSTPQQIGHAARHLANKSAANNESLEVALNHKGLKGPNLKLVRRDLEEAILNNHGSAEEIWQDINFVPNKTPFFKIKNYFKNKDYQKLFTRFIFDNKVSLSEEDSSALYRSSVLIETEKMFPLGFRLATTPRINIADNVGNIRTVTANPTRSNEGRFAANRFSLDKLYASWLHSINKDLHIKLSAGYLEEMFGGFGGEILYRPFDKTFSGGAEAWKVKRRDPDAQLALRTLDDERFTGHMNLFYELPNKNTTLFAKVGQYLDEDFGGTFGIKNNFKNGASLEGFITATDQRDPDIFGGNTHLYGGVKFTVPFGNVPYVPAGSEIRITTVPFARDSGQILNAPNKLYEVTEPISYRHLSQNWSDLLH